MEKEIWKPSQTYPTHEASSLGRIRRVPFERTMPNGGSRMYGGKATYGAWADQDRRYVTVIGPKPVKTVRVARIVCDAFNGPPKEGEVCMHVDENSRNNRPENLSWGTQRENMNAEKFVKNRKFQPRKLSDDDVRAIRLSTLRTCDTARKFGVHPSTITNIVARRMRANVVG